jgi:hypothetical protein
MQLIWSNLNHGRTRGDGAKSVLPKLTGFRTKIHLVCLFGARLAGGELELIESIIDEELSGESVTIVNYVI